MTHAEFLAAYRAGRLRATVERDAARRFVTARTLLPAVLLPVFALALVTALLGHYVIGALVFLLALGVRWLVRASAQGFVLQSALHDERFYQDALAARVLRVEEQQA